MSLDKESRDKRKRIMERSIALGHCICDPRKPCPCPVFKDEGICECAGERRVVAKERVPLTSVVRNPGCASKISKNDLRSVLAGLPEIEDRRVLIGSSAGDDAGVIQVGSGPASILTVDVFAPSVDDPYLFGQVAAANSVSDIYAMGGKPESALSIIGFPVHELPLDMMHDILRGGVDKMAEAGIAVIGGHSINDEAVKCGFAVFGTAPEQGAVSNSGARVGDAIVLTKPIGGGIVLFGQQIGRASRGDVEAVEAGMIQLNKEAARCMVEYGVHAATDVTGYSLLGHLSEIVKNSDVKVTLDFDSIPLFPGTRSLACADVLPGAVERNRESVNVDLLDLSALQPAQAGCLFSPETSGGLLVILPGDKADEYVAALREGGIAAATRIGEVSDSLDGGRIEVTTSKDGEWKTCRETPAQESQGGCCESVKPAGDAGACCSGPVEAPASSCCESAPPASAGGFLVPLSSEVKEAYTGYSKAVNDPGALGAKQKKLISLALSVVTKCEPCVKINTRAAREAGATDDEIREAVALGISFGGASTNMFYNQLL